MPPVDKGSGGGLGGGLRVPAGISFGEAAASLGVCVDVAGERGFGERGRGRRACPLGAACFVKFFT